MFSDLNPLLDEIWTNMSKCMSFRTKKFPSKFDLFLIDYLSFCDDY